MKRIRTLVTAVVLTAAFSMSALAAGSSSDPFTARYNAQRDAIKMGVRTGVISETGAQQLLREQRMFRMQFEQYARNGLRADEKMLLESRLNNIEAMIEAYNGVANVRAKLSPPVVALITD